MEKKELIKWAIKGMNAEIEALDADIRQGKKYLAQLERGEAVKTPKTAAEIRQIIDGKAAEMEKLERAKFELKWEE
jgi:hypothetical protein